LGVNGRTELATQNPEEEVPKRQVAAKADTEEPQLQQTETATAPAAELE